jgi:hypothetical protein
MSNMRATCHAYHAVTDLTDLILKAKVVPLHAMKALGGEEV